jgi:hypothetical protein
MDLEELLVYILICFIGYYVGKLLLNCGCIEGVGPDGHRRIHSANCEGPGCATPSPSPPPPASSPSPSPSPSPPASSPSPSPSPPASSPSPSPSPPASSPSPSPPPLDSENECDTIVAKQWKKLICEQKKELDNDENLKSHPIKKYDLLLRKVQGIMDKEAGSNFPPLHPLSFDIRDKGAVGCDRYDSSEYWDNNYCIQVNQGNATCKPDYGSTNPNNALTCETLTTEATCNGNEGCAWRVPNLFDKYEELSVQIGTCPDKPPPAGSTSKSTVAYEPRECDNTINKDLIQCRVDPGAPPSLYGDINAARDLIGRYPLELNKWCSPEHIEDPRPQKDLRKKFHWK